MTDSIAGYAVRLLCAGACAAALLAGCSNESNPSGTTPTFSFVQVDRVGKPGMNQIFSPYANHDRNARSDPSSDAADIGADVLSFVGTTAGRSSATAAYVQGLLVPNVLVADLSQFSNASYLGVETQGKLAPSGVVAAGGGLFGGRGLADDVVTADLGLAFGTTPSDLGGAPADGAQQNGTGGKPNLATDNVTTAGKHFITTFPYLGAPH